MCGRSLGHLLVIGALAGAPRETAARTLLLESYAGERPADADLVLAPLRERLAREGIALGAAGLEAWLGRAVALPGAADPALSAAVLAGRVERGWAAAQDGAYERAVRELEAALGAARESPACVVADQGAPAWLTKALAGLAFARGRLGDRAGAEEAMREQLRSHPREPVARRAYGPEVAALHAAVRRRLRGAVRGSLLVRVDAPGARIYLNEEGAGRGSTSVTGLLPGPYRVLVEAAGVARRYEVSVGEGEETRLSIDWALDARLTAARTWAGFVAPRGAPDPAARLGPQLARGDAPGGVIVVGIVRRGARRLAVGHAYAPGTGALVRAGSVELGAGAAPRLSALAAYLAGGARAEVGAVAEAAPLVEAPWRRPEGVDRAAAWAAAGAAAAFAAGAALLVMAPEVRGAAPAGWALLGGGAAAAVFSAHRAGGGRRRPPAITLAPARGGGLAAVAGRF